MHESQGLTSQGNLRHARIQEKRDPGTLVTLTGPSGCGKTTIAQLLTALRGDFCEACSHTTRAPRNGEIEGISYHFVNDIKFEAIDLAGGFLESIEYNGTHYGISKQEISDRVSTGKHTILVVEPVGAGQIRRRYRGKLVQIFIDADVDRLRSYMLARGDSPESADKRILLDQTAIQYGDQPWDARIANNSSISALCQKVMALAHGG